MTTYLPKFNPQSELQVKILYWGPGEAGKTTCFLRLLEIFSQFRISKGFSIATTDDRTLWNDSVHFSFPMQKIHTTLITNVTTTTGQERFLSTREYILQNADGAIFIADAQKNKMTNNKRSFEEIIAFTRTNKIPMVIQLNKKDLPNTVSIEEFKKEMKLPAVEKDPDGFKIVYETIATDPEHPGVRDAFFSLVQKILKKRFVKT